VLRELISTEEHYNSGLKILKFFYKQPLMTKNIFPLEEITKIFSPSLNAILLTSDKLLEQLLKIPLDTDDHHEIGRIFIDMMGPMFEKSYLTYITGYEDSILAFEGLIKENKQFAKFVQATEKKRRM